MHLHLGLHGSRTEVAAEQRPVHAGALCNAVTPGRDVGDVTTLANPEIVEEIRRMVQRTTRYNSDSA